jgi:hypothetical protein
MIVKKMNYTLLIMLFISIIAQGCSVFGGGKDDEPEEITLPGDPIEKAAIQGLITSYHDSTMWQIQKAEVVRITPMAPSGALVELQDPKEIFCVCVGFEARYKVEWTTTEGSPWKRMVRNILVIKTQGDQYLPMRPMNVCAPFCE